MKIVAFNGLVFSSVVCILLSWILFFVDAGVYHTKTKAKSPQTNGICERFYGTMQEKLFWVAFRKKIYKSIEELQADLDEWLIILIVSSCQNKSVQEELAKIKTQVQLEEQNKSVVKQYWEGKWNERRPEILDELQTPDVIYHGTSMGTNRIAEYKQIYRCYLSAFSDSHVEISKSIAEGDFVKSDIKLTVIHARELDGLPPTGNKVNVSMFTIFRLVDGKIAEEWEVMDELGLMTQLGFELQMKE